MEPHAETRAAREANQKTAKDLINTATADRGKSGYGERWTRGDRAIEDAKEIAQAKATSEEVQRNIRCVINRGQAPLDGGQAPIPEPVEDARVRYRGGPASGGHSAAMHTDTVPLAAALMEAMRTSRTPDLS